jgi:hypothetical protein
LTASHAQPQAKLSHACLREIFLHLGDAAEIAVDFALALLESCHRRHSASSISEMRVIVVLARVVEEPGVFAE